MLFTFLQTNQTTNLYKQKRNTKLGQVKISVVYAWFFESDAPPPFLLTSWDVTSQSKYA